MHEYGITLTPWDQLPQANAMVAAVAHRQFKTLSNTDIASKIVAGGVFVDVKGSFDQVGLRAKKLTMWRL